jgi:hypothetical protein
MLSLIFDDAPAAAAFRPVSRKRAFVRWRDDELPLRQSG